MIRNTLTVSFACAVLIAFLTLPALTLNPWFAVAVVGILSFGTPPLLELAHVTFEPGWKVVLIPFVATLAAVVVMFLGTRHFAPMIWCLPLMAIALSWMSANLRDFRSRRCALCNRRLGRSMTFECPRCLLSVCDSSCWTHALARCRRCEENHVVIFPANAKWWDREFGPRLKTGRCLLCKAAASEVDLRACGRCGRLRCRDCWDFENGECDHCRWNVVDMPDALRKYVFTSASS